MIFWTLSMQCNSPWWRLVLLWSLLEPWRPPAPSHQWAWPWGAGRQWRLLAGAWWSQRRCALVWMGEVQPNASLMPIFCMSPKLLYYCRSYVLQSQEWAVLSSDLCQGKVQMSSIMLNARRYICRCKENCKTEKYKKRKILKIRCVVLNKVINNQINDAI